MTATCRLPDAICRPQGVLLRSKRRNNDCGACANNGDGGLATSDENPHLTAPILKLEHSVSENKNWFHVRLSKRKLGASKHQPTPAGNKEWRAFQCDT